MSTTFPYPGLRPFRSDESDIFFGREEQADQMLEKLNDRQFLAVVGVSGCGKSSLVKAGLIPALELGFMAGAGSRWQVADLRPGGHPMKRLAVAIAAQFASGSAQAGDSDAVAFMRATLRRGPYGLVELLRQTPLPPQTNLLLLVDQFEEIFRYRKSGDADEADAFVALLLASAAQREVPVYVVLTMRSDFLGDCALFADLPEAMNESQFLTPRLTREQRRAAIVYPARVFGDNVEAELVNRLLNDMRADPDQLPLMQHLMMLMWNRARRQFFAAAPGVGQEYPESTAEPGGLTLKLADYEAVGGLKQALSIHADEAFVELDPDQQRIAEVLFRALSERGADRRDTRRPVPLAGVAEVAGVTTEAVAQVLDVFRRPDRSFITPPAGVPLNENTVLDISHESLIRQWERLNQWARKEEESAGMYRRLEQEARLWKAGQAALWTTPNLENALDWQERERPSPEWAARYGSDFELAMQFLEAGQEKRRVDEAETEKAKKRLRQLQKHRRLLAVGAVLLVIVGIFAGWALKERSEAELAMNEALMRKTAAELANRKAFSRELGVHALTNLEKDYELSSLLALNAFWVAHTKLPPNAVKMIQDKDKTELHYLENILRRNLLGISRTLGTFSGHSKQVVDVDFSPDGDRLVTASVDETAKVWDVASRKELFTLAGHSGWIMGIAFSPNGKYIATASRDKTAKIWDAANQANPITLTGHADEVYGVAFSPDGKLLATSSKDKTIRVWQIEKDKTKELFELKGHQQEVDSVVFSPDGRRLASSSLDHTAKVWDLETKHELITLRGHTGAVWKIAFSPDGHRIATASADKTAKVWNARDGKEQVTLTGHSGEVWGVAFSRDGLYLATSSLDKTVKLWDSQSGKELFFLAGHTDKVFRVAFSPDGTRLATGSADNTARLWAVTRGNGFFTFASPGEKVTRAFLNRDGTHLTTVSGDWRQEKIKVWDVATGEVIFETSASEGGILAVALSANGTRLSVVSGDWGPEKIKVWDVAIGKEIYTSWLSGEDSYMATLSDDGTTLAAVIDNWENLTIRVWNAATGKEIYQSPANSEEISLMTLSANGKRLAAVSGRKSSKKLTVWDFTLEGKSVVVELTSSILGDRNSTSSGRPKLAKEGDDESGPGLQVRSMVFSPDGTHLLVSTEDGRVIVWNASDIKAPPHILSGHTGPVDKIAFSLDGTRLATAGGDMMVKVWNAADFKTELNTLSSNTARVYDLAFRPDNKSMVFARVDGIFKVAPLSFEDLMRLERKLLSRGFTAEECGKYLGKKECPAWLVGPLPEETK